MCAYVCVYVYMMYVCVNICMYVLLVNGKRRTPPQLHALWGLVSFCHRKKSSLKTDTDTGQTFISLFVFLFVAADFSLWKGPKNKERKADGKSPEVWESSIPARMGNLASGSQGAEEVLKCRGWGAP